MDYIYSFFSVIFKIFDNLSPSAVDENLNTLFPPLIFMIMFAVFIIDIIFYILKRPKGLSGLVLIIGIIGMFSILFISLSDLKMPIEGIDKNLSKYLLSSISMGIFGAILAGLLATLENIFAVNRPDQSVYQSIRDLSNAIKSNSHSQSAQSKFSTQQSEAYNNDKRKDLLHLSQQIYDLTNRLKKESEQNRENENKNTENLIATLNSMKAEFLNEEKTHNNKKDSSDS